MPSDTAREDQSVALYVTPRAGRTEVAGEREGGIWVRLAAAPVDGRANAALVELIARRVGVPKGDVTVVSGVASRTKRVQVRGVAATDIRARLLGHPKR